MTIILPITCRQLGHLILVGLFTVGISWYALLDFEFGFPAIPPLVLVGLAIMFGIVSLVIYIEDKNLIKCRCNK